MICDRSVPLVLTVAVVPSVCAGSSACMSCAEVTVTGVVATGDEPGGLGEECPPEAIAAPVPTPTSARMLTIKVPIPCHVCTHSRKARDRAPFSGPVPSGPLGAPGVDTPGCACGGYQRPSDPRHQPGPGCVPDIRS